MTLDVDEFLRRFCSICCRRIRAHPQLRIPRQPQPRFAPAAVPATARRTTAKHNYAGITGKFSLFRHKYLSAFLCILSSISGFPTGSIVILVTKLHDKLQRMQQPRVWPLKFR